jgi:E3 ubiquitin-protein ligase HUWE1
MDAFLKGFFSIVPQDLIKIFDNRELELLLSGLPTIDIDDLKDNCTYENYTARSKPILFLWAALKELN